MNASENPFSLDGQRVLIVGASSGIGLAAARLVDTLGGVPILASRSASSLERARSELPHPERAATVPFDYLDADAAKDALRDVGRIDHLMVTAVADENLKRGAFEALDQATMESSFDKFWGQINVVRAALPHLAEDGSVTLFASIAGIKPAGAESGLSVMNAVQAGVIQLARSLAVELAPRRVNVIAPGVVLTNVWTEEQRRDLGRWMESSLPVRRAGQPEDIAMAALSLMTNQYITGVVLPVDGGMLPVMSAQTNRSLTGQTVAILGGSGAMGSAAAAELSGLGAKVVLVGRDRTKLEAVAEDLGSEVSAVVADATQSEDLAAALAGLQPLDHIVVAISANASASSVGATSPETAERAFARYWVGYEVLHLAPKLIRRGGSVTLLSGSSARTPAPGYGVWTALHGAIEALAKAASIDIAPIRVNIVSPGGIGMKPDRQLVERQGRASDIGAAVAALVANPAITGAVLDVDSGERKGSWSGEPTNLRNGERK